MPFEKMPGLPKSLKSPEESPPSSLKGKHKAARDFEKEMEKAGRTIVGRGTESVVEVHPHRENVVAAHLVNQTESTGEMRKIYFTHRVLHTLFPNYFPAIHAAFERTEEKRGGTIRSRVDVKRDKHGTLGRWLSPKSFRRVEDELQSMGISAAFDELSTKNFGRAKDGYEQYLDVAPNLAKSLIAQKDRVIKHMRENGYVEGDITKVSNSIDRLALLQHSMPDRSVDK